jgi:hypothetical protein
LVHTKCVIAKRLHNCVIVNGNRILGPKLRSTLHAMVASRVLERMERSGMMASDDVPRLHEHRLVGLHTEDNFIYSDVSSSSAPAGIPIAAVADLMSMAPIVDTSAAASSQAEEEVVEPAEEEMADYGEYKSPIVGPDAASSPAATTIWGARDIQHREGSRGD